MSAEPSLAEIVRLAIDSRLLDVHVALPCRVEVYNPATQTVDALPMVRRAIVDSAGNTQHEELPVLPNVPVLFPRSAAFSATWPIAKGDHVLVVFCSSAIGNWRQSGDIADPGDLRRHDLSHAVAIPGVAPDGDVLPVNPLAAVVEVNPPATHVTIGAGASEFVALSNHVDTFLGDIAAAIAGAGTTPNDGGAAFKAAILAALATAGWTGGGAVPPNSTAATKLKSE
jgi:hypothetical protein